MGVYFRIGSGKSFSGVDMNAKGLIQHVEHTLSRRNRNCRAGARRLL